MRLTSRLFILALCAGDAIPPVHFVGPPSHIPGYKGKIDNLNNLATIRVFLKKGRPPGLQSPTYTGIQFSQCCGDSSYRSPFKNSLLPLPVTTSRGSGTTIGTARLSTFVLNIRSFQKRLNAAAKLSVALCIAFGTAVRNRFRVDDIALRSWIDGVVALCIAFQTAVGNRFRVDSVELRRRIIDGVVVAFSVSIVSSIASYYIVNKIQGQVVTVVVDPDVVRKLLQDEGLRSCKSIERQ